MTWYELEIQIRDLAEKVRSKPDLIVGVTRGGLVPARLMARALDVKDMYCITVKRIGEERKVLDSITEDIAGKYVLVVDDMLETGHGLALAKKYLEEKGATVDTACMYIMPHTYPLPTYYLREVTNVKKFAWE
jgi:hypoxanthine phosphoribosyltransferase